MAQRNSAGDSVDLSTTWLGAYEVGHTQHANRVLHWFCAPVFMAACIGLLSCVPMPRALVELSPAFHWGTLFVMASIVYYFIMSTTLAIGAIPFLAATLAAIAWLEAASAPVFLYSAVALLLAATGQFIGHRLEGGKASLVRDLHYVAIAPIWVLAGIYRKLNIPY
jgi:uncharacterized membrane protein YGL010W